MTATATRTSKNQLVYYRFITQNNFAFALRFFARFFTVLKMPNCNASFMEDINKRRRISFSLSKLMSVALKKSIPGKFAYIFHFQQIGINPTEIEKTGIDFKKDVFFFFFFVDAKAH